MNNANECHPVINYYTDCTGPLIKNKKTYSYVAVLCRKDGEVSAVRCDEFARKADVIPAIEKEFPNWKLKTVLKLYEEDFG